ncbi:MAG: SDR family oxidoreductase [bacterium]|nr:SDR family oxidoreductase [bacterium]
MVTGAGRGIGRAIALGLATDGLAVGVLDRDADGAADTAAAIAAAGGRARACAADVTVPETVAAALAALEAALGPPSVLVNNAGWDVFGRFVDSDPRLWDRLIDVNLKGVLHVARLILPGMIARAGGRVVNVASDAGRVGSSGEVVYSACKAGVIGFTKAAAREVARHQVTVNAVCPGPTETRLLAEVMAGEQGAKVLAGMRRAIPLGRLGRPEDVAGAVRWLVSPGAAYVTGQVISVSGGLTMAG